MNSIELPFNIQNANPYVIIIVAFIALMVLTELLSIPKRIKARAAFKNLTGRAMATVTDYRKVRELRYRSTDSETNDSYEYKTYISYQFEVNGQVYTGEGEGDGAFWKKDRQMICYDPSDPNDNCTLYTVDSMTKSHFLKTLIFIIVALVIFYLVIVGFAKLGK